MISYSFSQSLIFKSNHTDLWSVFCCFMIKFEYFILCKLRRQVLQNAQYAYASFNQATTDIDAHTRQEGYVIVVNSTKRDKNKEDRDENAVTSANLSFYVLRVMSRSTKRRVTIPVLAL